MKHFILAVAMGLLPSSLYAQDALPEPEPIDLTNPERNFNCALYALTLAQGVGAEEKERQLAAFGFFLYFVGRYEGSTDEFFEPAFLERAENMKADDLAEISLECLPEIGALTVKLKGYRELTGAKQ